MATIALCAGHGGTNNHAKSPCGLLEKDLNLKVALWLRDMLQAAGHTVLMARTTDVNANEAQFAANINGKCDLALAIHFNGFSSCSSTDNYT